MPTGRKSARLRAARSINNIRQRLSLDIGWRFHLGDIAFPAIKGHAESYRNAKAGCATGAAAVDFDDTEWRRLNLPHDWAVEGPFVPEENLSQGFRKRGIAWYRRHFALADRDRGRHLELQFDGIATHCTVWVNGFIAHRNWCGSTSFNIDITPIAKFGDELNTIAIRVDADAMDGWWYEGAGIYRHTWLMKREKLHIVSDGLYISPVRDAEGRWIVAVEVRMANFDRGDRNVTIGVVLQDQAGNPLAEACFEASIEACGDAMATCRLVIDKPRVWSIEDPTLYIVSAELLSGGKKSDIVRATCGFRTLRFDAVEGFFLNDTPLKLKGVCCHQDHAGVGVAIPDAIWEFRLRRLKEMGVNAYRCAHNPPPVELLDLCDRLGILVMDENRHFNTSPEYMRQLEWLVRRDRSHPSVFLWSIFNEEPIQETRAGYECARMMVALVKRLDSTRPTTAGMNSGLFSAINASQAIDVVGINYQSEIYDRLHKVNAGASLISTEDTSGLMTRGEMATNSLTNVMGSYDTERAPWGNTHRDGWREIAKRQYLSGGFVWTGFDYRGEPTPYEWPSVSSFFGCMDLCGFAKTAFYIHQAHWIRGRIILRLLPHWNWPGKEGQLIRVMACTNAESVSLFVNGKSFGEKLVDPIDMATWDVPYYPGRLEAIAKRKGKEIAREVVETVEAPESLRIVPFRSVLLGDGLDSQALTVEVVDRLGRPSPTSNIMVNLTIEGPGIILGHGNGDPNCHEAEKGSVRSLFNGLAQVIVQSVAKGSGRLVVRVDANGFKTAEVKIYVKKVPPNPFVPEGMPTLFLNKWRTSPAVIIRPDPNQYVPDHDMNSWASIIPGNLTTSDVPFYVNYRNTFQPFSAFQANGGLIVFKSITGSAEVWLDNRLVGRKRTEKCGSLVVLLRPKIGRRGISVLVRSRFGESAGFSGPIFIRSRGDVIANRTITQRILIPINIDPS